jgi:hypothetical protein
MTVRTHTFNGRKYKITIGKMDGPCDTYNKERETNSPERVQNSLIVV